MKEKLPFAFVPSQHSCTKVDSSYFNFVGVFSLLASLLNLFLNLFSLPICAGVSVPLPNNF